MVCLTEERKCFEFSVCGIVLLENANKDLSLAKGKSIDLPGNGDALEN